MKLTIFTSQNTKNKVPISPYGDKTFVFETYDTTNNLQMFNTMVSHFILNIPLELVKKPIRTYKRKVDLDSYYGDSVDYIILDIDEVKSEFHKQTVLQYFNEYKVILGESKGYNGIDNFNLKGVLFIEKTNISDLKYLFALLHKDLEGICEIDDSASRKATHNAPILKCNVFLNNEDGNLFRRIEEVSIDRITTVKNDYLKISGTNHTGIETICLEVFQSMGFIALKSNTNGSICFSHPSEHKTPGGYFWFNTSPYTMHHFNYIKTLNIFETVRKLDIAKELMRKNINYDCELTGSKKGCNTLTIDERFLSISPEVNGVIQKFINNSNGLLSIRSPMGTGKSTLINHIVNECHDNDMKVLIITNRISVAHDFGKKYNMKVYNIDKYEIGDSLICQYDSLWRYNIKFFDVIIMDEFMSLLLHSRNNMNNTSINVVKFYGAFNKKLVIADAFLTGYENTLLGNKTHNIHMIDNTYRDTTEVYSYMNFNKFVDSLALHAERHKITVSSTSLNFINALQLLLMNKKLRVVTLTADTPESTKELIYREFDKEEHDRWDVLIYSPTLTVGVSNLNNVDYHFHYDGSMSTNVISSIQMIKRTRKAKEIHMFVKERVNYLKTTYNDIRDEYMGNVGKNIEHNYLFNIDDYGEAKLSNIGKVAIKIDTFSNILEFNHRDSLMWLLKYHFSEEPKIIQDSFTSNILLKYQKQAKDHRELTAMANVEQFLELNDIDKSVILLDPNADKIMKTLTGLELDINGCPPDVKIEIIKESLRDNAFIQRCKYYRTLKEFSENILDQDDIRHRISLAVQCGNNDDLQFFNTLIGIGQIEIRETYKKGEIARNKNLKYLLDRCGFSNEAERSGRSHGVRAYRCDDKIKLFYKFIQI